VYGSRFRFLFSAEIFGGTKQEEWRGLKRSIAGMLWVFGIIFILPSMVNLVSSFFHKVIWGSMTLGEYSKHIGEFSVQATYNFYADLFRRLPKF